ncbi:MAG: UbiA family prenyltransferase [Nitrososphaeraceae archaeon]
MSVQQIMNYLTLVRFPNLFTLPSNVLAGYFSSNIYNEVEINTIILVIFSSACLYAAGVIFNDIADRQIDRKERPNRPIPSGKVTQRSAIILALLLMAISITVSYLISAVTFIVGFILVATIMLYDFVLKNSLFGPMVMGTTRVLNILLGASPNLSNLIVGQFDDGLYRLCLVCFSEFVYIASISALSRYETNKNPTFHLRWFHTIPFLLPLSIGVYTASVGLFNGNAWIYLFIFGSFIFSTLKLATSSKPMTDSMMQKIISLLIAGIIVHDAVYIGGSLDSWYFGMGTFVFLVPMILLGKKFYVT